MTEWLVPSAQSGKAAAVNQLLKIWYPKFLRYTARQLHRRAPLLPARLVAINFVHATDLGVKLNWFGGAGLAFLVVVVLRLWYFMELNRLSIRRDIKRVELQVSLLGTRIESLRKS